MRAGHFQDDAVRAQQCQPPGDAGGPALALDEVGGGAVECGAHVSVAKTAEGPLAPGDGFQQRGVVRRPRVERTVSPALLVTGRQTDRAASPAAVSVGTAARVTR